MNDDYGCALSGYSNTPPYSHDDTEVTGWHSFPPDEGSYDRVREIRIEDTPVSLKAYNLCDGVEICFVFFRDQGDCTQSTSEFLMVCGERFCLTECNNAKILAVPGRYSPVVTGPRSGFVFLEETPTSTEMAQLGLQQLQCCCP